MPQPLHYALLGKTVIHSLSPRIHRLFGQQFSLHIDYLARDVTVEEIHATLHALCEQGTLGFNITAPYKQLCYAWAHSVTPRAQQAGTINTIAVQASGQWLGDNTDGAGLLYAIQELLVWPVCNKRILLLGAGGAACGILPSLVTLQPQHIAIVNRTWEHAVALQHSVDAAQPVRAYTITEIADYQFDVIINATTLPDGLLTQLPPTLLTKDAYAYDILYQQPVTAFMQWCHAHGARHTANGLSMLVAQAAEAFYLWHGVRPDVHAVLAALTPTQ